MTHHRPWARRSASLTSALALGFMGFAALPAHATLTDDPTGSTDTQTTEGEVTPTADPVEEAPAEIPLTETPVEETPVEETPAEVAPAEVTPTEEISTEEAIAEEDATESVMAPAAITTITLLGITDFHGAIENAPKLETQFDAVRATNPNTYFVAAGDLIGGSAYISSIADDQPTIDVLNAMGLGASAVGNHEFDAGYADLRDRVMTDNAQWTYLGANVDGAAEINTPPYAIQTIDGVDVAFIGTVTEETPTIVSAGGIQGLAFLDPVVTTNNIAAQLSDGDPANGEADVVVALFHDSNELAEGLSSDIDVAFTGHTHVTADRVSANGVHILQAGASGSHFGRADISFDDATGTVTVDGEVVALDASVAADPEIQAIVDEAEANAAILGAEQVGTVAENAFRGANDGAETGSNRGTESSLGNILGDAALYTANELGLNADFGIINPGGIRDDLDKDANGIITYGEAYSVQPFGNTIGTIDLTGAQVKTMLEQQWQPGSSRPMLRLGLSENFEYTYDPARPHGDRVTSITIDGVEVDPAATYTVASNTFLLEGQDGFTVFTEGTNLRESGYIDLDGFVDYLGVNPGLTVPEGQRSVGVTVPELNAGFRGVINVESLSFTAPGDEKPETVEVLLNGVQIGSATLNNAPTVGMDDAGKAAVRVVIPADAPADSVLTIVAGDTVRTIPVTIGFDNASFEIVGITDFHGAIEQAPYLETQLDTVRAENPNTYFVAAGDLIGGSAYISSIADDQPTIDVLNAMGLQVSAVGNHEFDAGYADLRDRVMANNAQWEYLGANVEGAPEINDPPFYIETIDGVDVAFIGTVTEETPEIVSAGGIQGLTFTDPVAKTNDLAARLTDGDLTNGEADVIVALFHDSNELAEGISSDVDLVFAGHTHVTADRVSANDVEILQAGASGSHFGRASITVDTSGNVTVDGVIVPVDTTVAADPEIQAIVDEAEANAAILGAEQVGTVAENAFRGANDGAETGSNRGTESSLGNILGDAALYTARDRGLEADFGIINPGGIRDDLDQNADGVITYEEAYNVQPFGNTIGTIDLTGAQVKTMLEQQWQPGSSRPMLRLGLSENFEYTYDPARPHGDRVTSIKIDGVEVDPAATYTVASNTFLLGGQDGFSVLAEGTNLRETGYVDLDGFVDYLAANPGLTVPEGQRSVGVTVPELTAGYRAVINVESLSFTAPGDDKPATVELLLNGEPIGSATLNNVPTVGMDDAGKAAVNVVIPADAPANSILTIVAGDTSHDVAVTVLPGRTSPVYTRGFLLDTTGDDLGDDAFMFGRTGDEPLIGDWDGDGDDTIGVRRGAEFFLKNSLGAGPADVTFIYGRATDDVLVGDWDGDGDDTIAVVRGQQVFVRNSLSGGNADMALAYGRATDTHIAGDWNGDGTDTIGVKRGNVYMLSNDNRVEALRYDFGRSTDIPVVGDFDGDSIDTVSVRRGTLFFINNSNTAPVADRVVIMGAGTEVPAVGDFNGDGITELGIYR